MGGYGGLFTRRAQGLLDAPEVRALVVEDAGHRVAIASVDLVIARPDLREETLGDPSLGLDALMLSATHTHSGPGGYLRGWLAERMTAGDYETAMPGALSDAIRRAVSLAIGDLAPAAAGSGVGLVELARNRRFADGPAETTLPILVLRFPDDRAPIVVACFAAHPTVLSPRSKRYSADYLGPAREALEREGWRALLLPGPLGDQEPLAEPDDLESGDVASEIKQARAIGEKLAGAIRAGAGSIPVEENGSIEVHEWSFSPPALRLRRFCAVWWAGPLVRGSARRFLSESASVQALRIGRALLLGLPAEPTTSVGRAIRGQVPEQLHPFVIAHANDWLGYVVTRGTYARGGYEACTSFHGPGLAEQLIQSTAQLIELLE